MPTSMRSFLTSKVIEDGSWHRVTIKSIKNVQAFQKYAVKNYKDAAACKKAVDKLVAKYNKSEAKEVED